jgi:hypothetical protein
MQSGNERMEENMTDGTFSKQDPKSTSPIVIPPIPYPSPSFDDPNDGHHPVHVPPSPPPKTKG